MLFQVRSMQVATRSINTFGHYAISPQEIITGNLIYPKAYRKLMAPMKAGVQYAISWRMAPTG